MNFNLRTIAYNWLQHELVNGNEESILEAQENYERVKQLEE